MLLLDCQTVTNNKKDTEMKKLLVLISVIFTLNSYACQCVQSFANAAYYKKESLITEHLKVSF